MMVADGNKPPLCIQSRITSYFDMHVHVNIKVARQRYDTNDTLKMEGIMCKSYVI